MQEMARVTEQASKQSAQAMNTFNTSIASVRSGLQSLGVSLSAAGLVAFAKSAIETANRFNAFALSLKNATGSAAAAQQSLAFVRTEANRLGLDLTKASEGFARLANATRGTALAGEATREIFTALSESSRVLGLSTEEYGRALTAVGQIALKGRVQQEELLQLAEAGIPIYGALAQSLGKTTGELAKMLEQGQVSATQLGAAFSVLRQQTQGVAEASDSFAARTVRLTNTYTELLVQVGRLITESANAKQALAELTTIMERTAKSDLRKELGFIEGTMKDIANILHIVNTLWARLSGDELQKARDAHAATETRIRGTKDELEFLKGAGDSAWKGYLLSLVSILTNAPSVTQTIKDQEEALKALGVQQDLQVRRVLSIERARRMASQKPATEASLFDEDIAGRAFDTATAEQALASLEELRRKYGKSAQERSDEFLRNLQHTAQEEKRIAQERKTAADRQAAEDKQRAEDRVAEIRRQQSEQEEADKARLDSNATVQREIQRFTLETTEFELLQFDERLAGFLALGGDQEEIARLRELFIQGQQAKTTEKTLQQFERIRDKAEQEHQREERETARSLEEQSKDYERFAKRVEETTGQFIFDVLSGRIESFKDLLGSIKDTFLKVLSDMVAAAIAKPIIIPIVSAVTGGLGLNQLLGMGIQTAAGATTGGGALGQGVAGAIGPGFAGTLGAGSAAVGGLLGTQFGQLGISGAGYIGGSAGSLSGLATTSLGGAALGLGAGVGGGFALRQLNNMLGLTDLLGKRGSSALAGAGGGAIAGSIIAPGIGTAIGAALGALLGGLLGGGKQTPGYRTTGGMAPAVSFLPGMGVTIPQTFDVSGRGTGGLKGPVAGQIGATLSEAANTLFGELESTMRQFPLTLQATAAPHLQAMTQEFEGHFRNVRFGGKNLAKDLESWVTKALPEAFHATFDPIIESMQKLAPVVAKFDELISALEQRQAEILSGIASARQSIEEALIPPAELAATRRAGLWTTLNRLQTGTPAEQMTLAPQLAAQTQEVFAQGLQQFQQDQALFQQRQGTALSAIGGARQGISQALLTPAQRQPDLWAMLDQVNRAAPEIQFELATELAVVTQQVFDQFLAQQNAAIQAFQQQQQQVLATIQGVRQSISEALLTPAQLAATRENTLQTLLGQFRAGTTAVQMELAPQIAGLTQEVFNQFLAQHQQAIQAFQQQQQQVLSTIEGARQSISSAMLTPEQLGATREQTLQTLLGQFRAGSTAVRMELAPQIAGLTQEVFNAFLQQQQQAIQAFQQQQAQVLATIQGARQSISSALLTPEQLAAGQRGTLQALLSQFRAGSTAIRMELAPQIAGLTQEVFNAFLQQQQQAIQAFQQQQEQALATIQSARQNIRQALMTPDQLAASQRGTLQTLLRQFRAGTSAVRMELVPQITSLTEEVLNAFLQKSQQAMQAFQQQQQQALASIEGARQSISEALLTPAQLAATRQNTLQTLLRQFRAGTTAVRMELVPQIASLTQEVLNQFLQQSAQTLEAFQQQQAQVLATIEGARQSLTEAMFTPEQLAATRQNTLQTLLSQFRAGATAVRMELAPQIASLTQEVFHQFLQQQNQAIQAFQQQQAQVMAAIEAARGGLRELVGTPAEQFERQRIELEGLMGQFRVSAPTAQLELAPQIAQMTQEILRLAAGPDVLEQDQPALRFVQDQMFRILAELESVTQGIQGPDPAAAAAMQQQMLGILAEIEGVTRHAVAPGLAEATVVQRQMLAVLAEVESVTRNAVAPGLAEATVVQRQMLAILTEVESVTRHAVAPGLGAVAALQQQMLGVLAEVEAVTRNAVAPGLGAVAALQQQMLAVLAEVESVTRSAVAPGLADVAAKQQQMLGVLAEVESVTRNAVAPGVGLVAAKQQEMIALLTALEAVTRATAGPDTNELRAFQNSMLYILAETEHATRQSFGATLQAANDQKTLLLESLHVERMIEFQLLQSIAWLAHLSAQLGWIGSFQTSPGQSRQVHMTGLAVVHRGETVSRGVQGGDTTTIAPSITVHVQVPPGSDGQAVGEEVSQAIFQTIRQIHRRERYRQTRRY